MKNTTNLLAKTPVLKDQNIQTKRHRSVLHAGPLQRRPWRFQRLGRTGRLAQLKVAAKRTPGSVLVSLGAPALALVSAHKCVGPLRAWRNQSVVVAVAAGARQAAPEEVLTAHAALGELCVAFPRGDGGAVCA